MGENDLVYHVKYSRRVSTTIRVKVYVYDSNSKIIISDIDGTITKYLFNN